MTTPDAAAETLINVMTQENDALAALDLERVTGLLADKQAATHALILTGEPGALAHGTVERLRGLAKENQALLTRALAVQGRVIALIASAGSGTPEPPRYGSAGTIAMKRQVAPRALSARA